MRIEPYDSSPYNTLVRSAVTAARNAYCPYSRFHVGAALQTASGMIYTGCNVENSSYGATICAERSAVAKAVGDGEKRFRAVAITGYRESEENMSFCMPCGICRQVLSEFAGEGFEIAVTDGKVIKIYMISELLPEAFGKK
jgi:cytidine deaminase